ncbi:MAG TPA: acyltransferase [Candidatus Krumholzibacteria bacterium]|nr:acyltransferase [Candidatus Krumholzibacteria bacterium]
MTTRTDAGESAVRGPLGLKTKDEGIETLRAFAIFLVVAAHVVNDPEMDPADDLYEYLNNSFKAIRMPLFTAISGYLYGLRPVRPGKLAGFLRGKARRLVLPLIVVSGLEYFFSAVMPGVNQPEVLSGIWRVVFFPYEHFWFLQVVAIIFVLVAVLDRYGWLQRDAVFLTVAGFSVLAFLYYDRLDLDLSLFSLGTVTYLLPFFLVGYAFSARSAWFSKWLPTPALLVLFGVGLALQQWAWFTDAGFDTTRRSYVGLAIAIGSASLLLRHRVAIPGVHRVGSHAYAIYLYQGFGTAVGRRIVDAAGITSPHLYILGVVGIALLFGIVVEVVLRRSSWLRVPFLGLRGADRRPSAPPAGHGAVGSRSESRVP